MLQVAADRELSEALRTLTKSKNGKVSSAANGAIWQMQSIEAISQSRPTAGMHVVSFQENLLPLNNPK